MKKTKYVALHHHPYEVLEFIKNNLEMARRVVLESRVESESAEVLFLEDTVTLLESISEARYIMDLRGGVKS